MKSKKITPKVSGAETAMLHKSTIEALIVKQPISIVSSAPLWCDGEGAEKLLLALGQPIIDKAKVAGYKQVIFYENKKWPLDKGIYVLAEDNLDGLIKSFTDEYYFTIRPIHSV